MGKKKFYICANKAPDKDLSPFQFLIIPFVIPFSAFNFLQHYGKAYFNSG